MPPTGPTTSINIGDYLFSMTTNTVSNQVFVAAYNQNPDSTYTGFVKVIDGATGAITSTITLPNAGDGNFAGMTVNPVTGRVYLADGNQVIDDKALWIIDGASNSASTVAAGSGPSAVATNPVTGKAYVANSSGNTVSVLDLATNTVTATATVGNLPLGGRGEPGNESDLCRQ